MDNVAVSDESFEEEVLGSPVPDLVDLWAEWCAPCKQIAPILEEIAQAMGERIRIVKMDIEAHPKTPTKLGIRQIPTLMIFREGGAEARTVGVQTKGALTAWIEDSLKG